MKTFTEKDIDIHDGWIHVQGFGRVGLWWSKFDKKVCLSFGFGESFYADTIDQVRNGILKILNNKL